MSNFRGSPAFAFAANNNLTIWLGGMLMLLMIAGLSISQALKSIPDVHCTIPSITGFVFIISLFINNNVTRIGCTIRPKNSILCVSIKTDFSRL